MAYFRIHFQFFMVEVNAASRRDKNEQLYESMN